MVAKRSKYDVVRAWRVVFPNSSLNMIAAFAGCSWGTVRRALAPQRGKRPRKLPDCIAQRRKLVVQLARKRVTANGKPYPAFPSASAMVEELQVRFGLTVCRRTVCRDLRASGFRPLVRKFVPNRSAKVHLARLRFAKEVLARKDLLRWVFTDETIVNSNEFGARQMWVQDAGDVVGREKQKVWNTHSRMVWAGIGVKYRTPIVLIAKLDADGNVFRLDGTRYIRILSKVAKDFLGTGRILQEDGARCHTCKQAQRYKDSKGIRCAPWTPYSPDLSPVENAWSLLKAAVSRRHPSSQEELDQYIVEEWAALPERVLSGLVRGFRKRLEQCVKRRGVA